MRHRTPLVLTYALLLGLVVPFAGARSQEVVCPTVEPPEVSFGTPSYIDRNRAGGEPVSIVAQDGSISVSAHAGTTHIYRNHTAVPGATDFAVGYFNQTLNWRSTDGGQTWKYIGLAGTEVGPHSLTSTGFSDPDFAMDQAGNIYNTEIDLVNVAVFKSPDDGQSYPIANPEAFSGDRPWLTALEEDEVFLYINLPTTMLKSEDGGITWRLLPTPGVRGKSYPDPLNPDDGLIGGTGTRNYPGGIAISDDDAQTWEVHEDAPLGPATQFFGAPAVDKAGWVYLSAAGGYSGGTDTNFNGSVTYAYFDRATESWGPQVRIPTPEGDALWPWMVAGDDGRVALVWYQTLKPDNRKFYIYAAISHNGHGTTVTCSDGSTRFIPPQFTVVNASGRPIHEGAICLNGTTCNAEVNVENADRRLGDFFTVNFDKDGKLFIVSGDTMLKNPLGGPKPVANPVFIKQSEGPPMLATPMQTRPTRCLFPLPTC
jgi:hypothetical protein